MTCSEKLMPLPVGSKSKRAVLEELGWQRQFTTDPTRLEEMVDFYQSLGYEVWVEPACDELSQPECASCFEKFCDQYKTIFVRKS